MTPTAGPTNKNSSHHLVLTQGATAIGLLLCDRQGIIDPMLGGAFGRDPLPRQSLQVVSGGGGYDDMVPPWRATVQEDWSAGMGYENLDKNASGYRDGNFINTLRQGEMILGGMPVWCTGYRADVNMYWPRHIAGAYVPYTWQMMYGALHVFDAVQFTTPTPGYTPTTIYLVVQRVGSPSDLNIDIYSEAASLPNVSIATATLAASTLQERVPTLVKITISCPALTAATNYWLVLNRAGSTVNYWSFLCADLGTASMKYSPDAATWYNFNYKIFYRITGADIPAKKHPFEYKGQQFCAFEYDSGAVSKLFMNGDMGAADVNASYSILADATKAWTTSEWVGCLVKINKGTGRGQSPRLITANDATTLTVSPAWGVKPDLTTCYVILASDKWTEVGTAAYPGGHGWTTQVVTDVLSQNEVVYFCYGDAVQMSRMWLYNTAGTWTQAWDTEAASTMGSMIIAGTDSNSDFKDGMIAIVRKGPPSSIFFYPAIHAGGGDLALPTGGTIQYIGDSVEIATGLCRYGEYGNIHMFKEGSIWQMIDRKPYLIPIQEMANTRDERNGLASIMHDVYLYFSWENSVLRYFQNSLDSVGIDSTPVGLPADRIGNVSAFAGYPGQLFKAIDGGAANYSSVLVYNRMGWCEVYRAPAIGMRIRALGIQSIGGDAVNRLWIDVGGDIVWTPISTDAYRHPATTYNFYPFWVVGSLTTSWMYVTMQDISKLFDSLKILGEVLGVDTGAFGQVWVEYQVDEGAWTLLGTTGYTEFGAAKDIGTNVTGKRIRFRYNLITNRNNVSPRVLVTVMDSILRIPHKFATTIVFRVADEDKDKTGQPDDTTTALGKFNQLDTWSLGITPTAVTSMIAMLDGKNVLLEQGGVRIIKKIMEEGRETYICQLTLIEV